MKVCLVSPPTITEFDEDKVKEKDVRLLANHAPIGILTIASVLEQKGFDFVLFDLNQVYYDFVDERVRSDKRNFACYAIERLVSLNFDVVGFGTICSTYPLTLRLAQSIRDVRPEVTIVMGGPQASAVDIATMKEFDFVDFIVRYEAEESFPELLLSLLDNQSPALIPGITLKEKGEVVRTESPSVISNLDILPLPAFHLYPYIKEASYIPLEAGRGCPYGCVFCSTNDFFRRKFRLKSPQLLVSQMKYLKGVYGVSSFALVHDIFTVDKKKVEEFCRFLKEDEGEDIFWSCSARTDRVDYELLKVMSDAGCRGIFFGIETGSQSLQKKIKKNLLLSDSISKIDIACSNGLDVAASLITGFPDETIEDCHDTVSFFVRSLAFENCSPQLNILAPLADTPLYNQYRDKLSFDDIVSDMSHQGWSQDDDDREFIMSYPEVFPNFYAFPTSLNRKFLKDLRAFLLYGSEFFVWLLSLLHQDGGHIIYVYNMFYDWLKLNKAELNFDELPLYFQKIEFRSDFFDFLRGEYIKYTSNYEVIIFMCEYFSFVSDSSSSCAKKESSCVKEEQVITQEMYLPAFSDSSVPELEKEVRILSSPVDVVALRFAVRSSKGIETVPKENRQVVYRRCIGKCPEILQLSDSSFDLLQLCDGKRTVGEIKKNISSKNETIAGVSSDKAVLFGLEMLRYDALIRDATV